MTDEEKRRSARSGRGRSTEEATRFGLGPRLLALVVGLGLATAACTSSGSASPEANSTPASDEAALIAFTQCMREQGVDMPDPVVDADGNVGIRMVRPDPGQREAFQAARDACAEHLQGVTQGFSNTDPTEVQDRLLQVARCLRERGFDVSDPDFSNLQIDGGRFMGNPFGDSLDFSDPAVQEALQTCRQEAFGADGPGGPGLFGGGG